jgi:4-aminobutyrate aminotransferase-like enzyme
VKDKGFLISYAGKLNNVLEIMPPLVFSHENAGDFLITFDQCMEEMGG